MARRIEVCGVQQKHLEFVYHNKIHEINNQLKRLNETYNNFDNIDDERLHRYTKEEFKHSFIDRKREERSYFVQKLRNVRNGFVIE